MAEQLVQIDVQALEAGNNVTDPESTSSFTETNVDEKIFPERTLLSSR